MQDANRNVAYLIVVILIGFVGLMMIIAWGAPLPSTADDAPSTVIAPEATAEAAACATLRDYTMPQDDLTQPLQAAIAELELPDAYVAAVDVSTFGEQCLDADGAIITSYALQTEIAFVVAGGFNDDIDAVATSVLSIISDFEPSDTLPVSVRLIVTPVDGGQVTNSLTTTLQAVQAAFADTLSDAELIAALGGWQF